MDEALLEKIPRFSWGEIKKRVTAKAPFEAVSPMGTALFRVRAYEPWIGLAIHAGRRVREELIPKMGIDEAERLYEEDAHVDRFISGAPVQMIGLDSRFEYDVNRPRERSVYLKPFESWGKKVWKTPPTKDELDISYQKYDEFHDLLDFLLEELTAMFGKIVVVDMHSYNYRRQTYAGRNNALPVFNLGTASADRTRHGVHFDRFLGALRGIALPGVDVNAAENDLFKGDGAVAKAVAAKFPDALLLNVEVKKVYMNELTGELNAERTQKLAEALNAACRTAVQDFVRPRN